MTRQELQQLSQAELIEIILQQQALISQLQDAVAELQEQIRRLTQPAKNASNSSVPPSQTRKPNRPRARPEKKRGPKPGHEGRRRRRVQPDTVIECRRTTCDQCGADLPQTGGRLLGRSQVVELPPIRPLVSKPAAINRLSHCGHQQAGQYPPGLSLSGSSPPPALSSATSTTSSTCPVSGWQACFGRSSAARARGHRQHHRPRRRPVVTASRGD